MPEELKQEIDKTVGELKLSSKIPPDRNTWILRAIRRELDHRRRSGKKR
jgi:hypothetical protein